MTISDEFLDFVTDQLHLLGPVLVRKMFGGAGLSAQGLTFALVADHTLYFKVDDSNRMDYEAAGTEAFQPFADKPYKMNYYEVPSHILEHPQELSQWANKALEVALRNPAKKRKK